MRFFGPLILVTCVALAYAAVLPPVRVWLNTATRGDVAGAIVLIAIGVGVVARLIAAARLDEWSWRKAADTGLGLASDLFVWIARNSARIVEKLSTLRTALNR